MIADFCSLISKHHLDDGHHYILDQDDDDVDDGAGECAGEDGRGSQGARVSSACLLQGAQPIVKHHHQHHRHYYRHRFLSAFVKVMIL